MTTSPTPSSLFAQVLPDGPVVRELRTPGDPATLLPDEAVVVAPAVESRRREFAAGRACARAALADLSVVSGPILPDAGRAPTWPDGVVGSITHCAGLAAAVVAPAASWSALGIDAEPAEPLPTEVVDMVLSPAERAPLVRLPSTGVPWTRVAFSAKESVYKVWFPMQRTWLAFDDAVLNLAPGGTFSAQLRPADVGDLPRTMGGRWAVADGFVVTAVALRQTDDTSGLSKT